MPGKRKKDRAPLPWTGERYVPELGGDIGLEHVHRYLLARHLATDKVVLDLASGEGYGSALLSEVAERVIGIDIAPDVIAHARKQYRRKNLVFEQGSCSAVPLPDASVDLIVSFETLEHISEHEQMMRECRRVLKPGGVLCISSPDRHEYTEVLGTKNPYHAKELTTDGFAALLRDHFSEVRLFGQRVRYGSLVGPIGGEQAQMVSFEGHDSQIEETPGHARPLYIIAYASDAPLPDALVSGIHWSPTVWPQSHELDALIARSSRLEDEVVLFKLEVANLNKIISERDAYVADLRRNIKEHEDKSLAYNQILGQRDERITTLSEAVIAQGKQNADLGRALAERDAQIAKRDAAIAERNARIVEREATIAEHHTRAAEFDAHIAYRDTIIAQRDASLADFDAHIAYRDTIIAQRDASIAELAQGIEARDRAIATIHRSASWRLTAPLRRIWQGLHAVYQRLHPSLSLLARFAYQSVPLPPAAKMRCKDYVFRNAEPLFRRTIAYRNWLEWCKEQSALDVQAQEAGEHLSGVRFAATEDPDISIIIPVYNQVIYTAKCLRALAAQHCTDSFEVIVMDDCSSDRTREVMPKVPGVRCFSRSRNLGFTRNCNRGAELARGRFLVFLNNDTEVMDGWLQGLRDTFREHPKAGVVGSKLIYPDNRLQEAGAIVWQDGNGWNWGRFEDPTHPRYNFLRDVDYVSGASFMIPRSLFFAVGKFSEELQNAYYEDTDLAFAVRAAGHRVLYQPRSQLVHHEGVSSGTDESAGIKRYQAVNRKVFCARWQDALKRHLPNGSSPEVASDRLVRGHILIVDLVTPTPDQDSGSVDMFNLIRILIGLNYRVHFLPIGNLAFLKGYTEALQAMGVECIYAPCYPTFKAFLTERGDVFDYVIMARVCAAEAAIAEVATLAPSAATIFYTVDLHGLRQLREAKLEADPEKLATAKEMQRREERLVAETDTAIVLSDYEAALLSAKGHDNVEVLPLIRTLPQPGKAAYAQRSDVVFIGGFQHPPNIDAAHWLLDEIWPRVRRLVAKRGLDPITVKIAGSNMPDWLARRDDAGVKVLGFVADLDALFGAARLSIAPLRYGAGLKGKLATSLSYGVPTVGTDVTFEGMPQEDLERIRVCAKTADELAQSIVDLYCDETRWQAFAEAGPAYVARHFSVDVLTPRVEELLDRTGARKAQANDKPSPVRHANNGSASVQHLPLE